MADLLSLEIESINKNKTRLATRINQLIENGRKEITTRKELCKYPIGSLISFKTVNNVYYSAGFLTRITKNNDYFVFITYDFDKKYKVPFNNVSKMWVGSVYKTVNDFVSLVESESLKKKCNCVVDGIIVYSADDPFLISRFKNTQKYQRMIKWVERFCDDE